MDALYMPQFHSARDIHDAYYIKGMKAKDVPAAVLKKVKAAHETGGDTGSTGWRYHFDVNRTLNMLLRTQGTACSARMLASGKADIPGMYFGLTRCFRYDVIDATHLPDFTQTEGIVIGEGLNMGHLVGLLKMFAKEFAEAEEIKIVPGYFPFTEPSAELFAKHPKLGWIELGGAGIFRPELVKPLLGKYVPVLAWGLGIDRIAMLKLGINDIRDMFSYNLEKLRNSRLV
jgi:phenylalanyl-tRNA synthetase alpha chain